MSTKIDNFVSFLREHPDRVVAFLAVVILAEALIIFLWARRSGRLRRELQTARQAAAAAGSAAAMALASDAMLREGEAAVPYLPQAPQRPRVTVERTGDGAERQIYSVAGSGAATAPENPPMAPMAPAPAVPAPAPWLAPPAEEPPVGAPPYSPPDPVPAATTAVPPVAPEPADEPVAGGDRGSRGALAAAAWARMDAAAVQSAPADAPEVPRLEATTLPFPGVDPSQAPHRDVEPVPLAQHNVNEMPPEIAALPFARIPEPAGSTAPPPFAPWLADAVEPEATDLTAAVPDDPSSSRIASWISTAAAVPSGDAPFPSVPPPPPPAPATAPEASALTVEPEAAPEIAAWPRKSDGNDVLLVEDDENVAKLYRMLLESRGYTMRHAPDGAIGLDEARRKRPDLILLDVMMPRMNGIMFLQSMREMDDIHDVPVVVLSNFKEPRLVERAMSLGALEYMVKAQTRPEALAGAIPRWIRGEKAFPF